MKTYKSSDLTHKRAEVLTEAKVNGVIIQQLETNGNIRQEFVLTKMEHYMELQSAILGHHDYIRTI